VRIRLGDRGRLDGVFLRHVAAGLSMTRADFYLIDKPRFRDDPLLLVCELAR
jgi:hypothetical protein